MYTYTLYTLDARGGGNLEGGIWSCYTGMIRTVMIRIGMIRIGTKISYWYDQDELVPIWCKHPLL